MRQGEVLSKPLTEQAGRVEKELAQFLTALPPAAARLYQFCEQLEGHRRYRDRSQALSKGEAHDVFGRRYQGALVAVPKRGWLHPFWLLGWVWQFGLGYLGLVLTLGSTLWVLDSTVSLHFQMNLKPALVFEFVVSLLFLCITGLPMLWTWIGFDRQSTGTPRRWHALRWPALGVFLALAVFLFWLSAELSLGHGVFLLAMMAAVWLLAVMFLPEFYWPWSQLYFFAAWRVQFQAWKIARQLSTLRKQFALELTENMQKQLAGSVEEVATKSSGIAKAKQQSSNTHHRIQQTRA